MSAGRPPAAVTTATPAGAFLGLLAVMAAASVAALSLAPAALAQESRPPLDLTTFPRTSLEITHHDQQHAAHHYSFEVWIADTSERAEQGLMFVSDLPANLGMIFPLDPPRVETMWMKNTYIELDMVFVGEKGEIDQIIEHAKPLSLETLTATKPVTAVLEIKGGEAARLGLKEGDRVEWTPASQ
jgi:uncharacterized protein